MKRFGTILALLIVIAILAAGPVYALSFPGWETIKGFAGAGAWQAAALILTALLGLAGLARYTPIISLGFITLAAIMAVGETVCAGVKTLFNFLGVAIEDGKISADEMKQVPVLLKAEKESIKATWGAMLIAIESFKAARKNG